MNHKLLLQEHKLLYHLDTLCKWQRGEFFYPLHLDIGASTACNYRCKHCIYDYLGHKACLLRPQALLGLVKELGRLGVKSIYFASAGEPLTNPAVPEAIVQAKKSGLDVAMSTNGALLNRDILEQILPSLSWLRFSILADSRALYRSLHKASFGDHQKVFVNIKTAAEIKEVNKLDTTIGVQTCLLSDNAKEIPLLAKTVKDSGLNYMTIRPISVDERNSFKVTRDLCEKFAKYLRQAEDLSDHNFQVRVRWDLEKERKDYTKCYGLPFISYLAADGGIYACGCFLEEEKYCLGNIYESSFEKIWGSPRAKAVIERVCADPDLKRCDILCRHHSINKFLNQLKKVPAHVNFI